MTLIRSHQLKAPRSLKRRKNKKNKAQDSSSDAMINRTQTESELVPTERERQILEYQRLFEEENKNNTIEKLDKAMIHKSGK